MAEPKKKKKKKSAAEMHRTVQDQVQALPFAVAHLEKEGKRTQAFIVKYLTGPVLRLVNKVMNRTRYKGTEGAKLKQSEQMKRHLEQRRKATEYMQGEMQKMQKRAQKRGGGGGPGKAR
ncbi:MAG: hypothetical protein JO306_00220 [Gemmatimonadetes bacterium]|nr:hypothetical protein [Gemmatimonadota bacterium]